MERTISVPLEAKRVSVRAGVLSGIALIGFFLLMKLLSLHYILELRYANIVFLYFGVLYAITQRKKYQGEIEYLPGLLDGLKTTSICVLMFSAFFVCYLLFLDTDFMLYLQQEAPLAKYITPWTVAGVLLIEGFISGGIISFCLMQYYKNNKEVNV
jgi:hypothetical protein